MGKFIWVFHLFTVYKYYNGESHPSILKLLKQCESHPSILKLVKQYESHPSGDSKNMLNKRSELISKCRHENKFYLNNYKTSNKDEPKKCSAHKNGERYKSIS